MTKDKRLVLSLIRLTPGGRIIFANKIAKFVCAVNQHARKKIDEGTPRKDIL